MSSGSKVNTTGKLFGKMLNVLENSTEAIGKLKGKFDLLEREYHALREKLVEHDSRDIASLSEIRKELDEVGDLLKELKNPIEKLTDAFDAADEFYAPQVQEVINQLDIVTRWIENQEKIYEASVKGKWGFWTAVTVAFLTQIGIIVGLFLK